MLETLGEALERRFPLGSTRHGNGYLRTAFVEPHQRAVFVVLACWGQGMVFLDALRTALRGRDSPGSPAR